jgi:hypothetical protein
MSEVSWKIDLSLANLGKDISSSTHVTIYHFHNTLIFSMH